MDGLIKLALEQREAARVRKDFAAADQIRDQIAALGITVEDTSNGPRWSY
jgi:cysteinyl-tRNA synthetase